MSIFEKLKNALFEEEYVEVEEKPKTKSIPKKKVSSKDKIKEKYSKRQDLEDDKEMEEEKPVAKKVVLPEKKEVYVEDDVELTDEDFEIKPEEESRNTFKMIDDDDFSVDDTPVYPTSEPKIVKVIDKDDSIPPYSVSRDSRDQKLYPSKPKSTGPHPYGIEETPQATVKEYNSYEQKEEKSYFKPSPIISPIYGILDKNYSKEDIVPKREIKFTSSFVRDKVSVDDVREKAFGNTIEEKSTKISTDSVLPTFEVEDSDSNLLVDLSSDNDKPAVKDVTMGDALEYFQDLGLEYNVDYVDAETKATGRREKASYGDDDITAAKFSEEDEEENKTIVEKKEEKKEEVTDDDNLFDLIDSMYQDQD